MRARRVCIGVADQVKKIPGTVVLPRSVLPRSAQPRTDATDRASPCQVDHKVLPYDLDRIGVICDDVIIVEGYQSLKEAQ